MTEEQPAPTSDARLRMRRHAVSLSTILAVVALCAFAEAQLPQVPQTTAPAGPITSQFDTAYLVVLGDFDGDGHDDAVTASVYGMEIRLANPGGTLRPPTYISFFSMPIIDLTVADLDNDGRDELLIERASTGFLGGGIDVKRCVIGPGGVPSLIHVVTIPAPYFAGIERFLCADVNGDLLPDLIIPEVPKSTVSIFMNTGNPSTPFVEPASVVLAVTDPRSVGVSDLNGDGLIDIVVSYGAVFGATMPSGLAIFAATAPGVFTPASPLVVVGPNALAIGDVDADNLPDLAVATDAGTLLLKNTTAGVGSSISFATAITIDPAPTNSKCVVHLIDIDADTDLDVVVGPVQNVQPDDGFAVISSQSGAFAAPAYSITTGPIERIALGDLDADSDRDVVALASDLGQAIRVLDLFANETVPAIAAYPGTPDALALASSVLPAHPTATGGPLNDVKPAAQGQVVTLFVEDPSGLFSATLIVLDGFVTGTPVASGPPGVWTTNTPIFVGVAPLPFQFGGVVPAVPTLVGTSALVQAFALGATAANGSYAATDAHELQLY